MGSEKINIQIHRFEDTADTRVETQQITIDEAREIVLAHNGGAYATAHDESGASLGIVVSPNGSVYDRA
jgi:hypothetical protein